MKISIKTFENKDTDSVVKANATLTIDDMFVVKNLSVIEGKNGLFVNMPHHKTNEVDESGKAVYRDDAFPLSKELRDKIQELAIRSYENHEQDVSAVVESPTKAPKEKEAGDDEKESPGQGKASVLGELKVNEDKAKEKKVNTKSAIKVTMEKTKKSEPEI